MVKQKAYKKSLILLITIVFTLVNLSVVSSVYCYMKDEASCCCKPKAEKKSCCSDKKEVKFTSHCGCEIREARTEPAELFQNYTVSSNPHTLKIFESAEISYSETEKTEVFSGSIVNTFHSPPRIDINTLKCVLRI